MWCGDSVFDEDPAELPALKVDWWAENELSSTSSTPQDFGSIDVDGLRNARPRFLSTSQSDEWSRSSNIRPRATTPLDDLRAAIKNKANSVREPIVPAPPPDWAMHMSDSLLKQYTEDHLFHNSATMDVAEEDLYGDAARRELKQRRVYKAMGRKEGRKKEKHIPGPTERMGKITIWRQEGRCRTKEDLIHMDTSIEGTPNVNACFICEVSFWMLNRRRHCLLCARSVCNGCSSNKQVLIGAVGAVRICDDCVKWKDPGSSTNNGNTVDSVNRTTNDAVHPIRQRGQSAPRSRNPGS